MSTPFSRSTRIDRRVDRAAVEHHRPGQLNVFWIRIRVGERHVKRRAGRLAPHPVSINRRTVRGVVLVDRAANDLTRVPLGVEQRRVRDDDVAPNALDLLRIPQRERVVVADRHEHAVRLDRVQHVGGDVSRRAMVRARRGAPVRRQRHERQRHRRRRQHPTSTGRLARERSALLLSLVRSRRARRATPRRRRDRAPPTRPTPRSSRGRSSPGRGPRDLAATPDPASCRA